MAAEQVSILETLCIQDVIKHFTWFSLQRQILLESELIRLTIIISKKIVANCSVSLIWDPRGEIIAGVIATINRNATTTTNRRFIMTSLSLQTSLQRFPYVGVGSELMSRISMCSDSDV